MTQRIFDIENEKDMALLWSILPDDINKIKRNKPADYYLVCYINNPNVDILRYIKINWHDKKEITRPIQEATEADIGELCYFWDGDDEDYSKQIGLLTAIKTENNIFRYVLANSVCFAYCRRLTKQEIDEFI